MFSNRYTPKRKITTTCLSEKLDDTKRPRTEPVQLAEESQAYEQSSRPASLPVAIQESLIQRVEEALKIAPPVLQNQLEIRLKQILPGNGRIAFVRVENYLSPNGQISCRVVTETQSRKEVWSSKFLSNAGCLKANIYHVIIGGNKFFQHYGELFIYSTMSGALISALRYKCPVMRLTLEDHICGIQLSSSQVIVRDLKNTYQIAYYDFTPQLARIMKEDIQFELTKEGIPLYFMKNGNVWFYSKRYGTWRQFKPSIDVLTSLNTHLTFLKQAAPEGFVTKLIENKQLKAGTISSVLVAETEEEKQIEILLNALEELNYQDEYVLLAFVYVNRLVARGKERRLYAYIETLKTLEHLKDYALLINKVSEEVDRLKSYHAPIQI